MIEFEKINEKGQKLKAYTHINYLSSNYGQQIKRVEKRNQTWSGVTLFGTTILTYWALNNVPVLNNFVANKLAWRGKYLIVSGLVGLIDSFFLSVILAKSLRSTHESLLKKEVFPAWISRDKVVNPERVYFQLDDSHNNEPSIWHSSLTPAAAKNLIPDFVVGTAHKPHYPVAEQHHH